MIPQPLPHGASKRASSGVRVVSSAPNTPVAVSAEYRLCGAGTAPWQGRQAGATGPPARHSIAHRERATADATSAPVRITFRPLVPITCAAASPAVPGRHRTSVFTGRFSAFLRLSPTRSRLSVRLRACTTDASSAVFSFLILLTRGRPSPAPEFLYKARRQTRAMRLFRRQHSHPSDGQRFWLSEPEALVYQERCGEAVRLAPFGTCITSTTFSHVLFVDLISLCLRPVYLKLRCNEALAVGEQSRGRACRPRVRTSSPSN